MIYLNLHTHHPTGARDVQEIESLYFGQTSSGMARYFSAGLHPWYLKGTDLTVAEVWLRKQSQNPSMLAIGEAGLDKLCNTPWAEQIAAFDLCIELAIQLNKPLIIHCVRAFEDILQQLKKHRFLPSGKAVFHGFDKHSQTAAMLLKAGCHLSYGAALLRPNSHAAAAFQQTPADRFFLETDDKDIAIQQIYVRAANLRETDPETLSQLIRQNAQTVFGRDLMPPNP